MYIYIYILYIMYIYIYIIYIIYTYMWCVTYVTYKIINMAHLLPLKLQPYNKIIKQCILHFHEGGGPKYRTGRVFVFCEGGGVPP